MKNLKYIISIFLITFGFLNAQTLTVSSGNNNHASSFEDPDGTDVIMVQLKLAADADMDVTAITIDPNASGLKRGDLVDNEILIYEDKNDNGVLDNGIDEFIASDNYNENSNQTPSSAVTVSIPDKVILNGTVQNWIIVHTFTGAKDRDDISIDITGISVSSGSVSGLPVNGNTRTIETNASSKNGSLFIGTAGKNPVARNVSSSATNEVMLQMIVATSTLKSATISQIDFDMSGSGHENTDLTSARLFIDGDANGVLNLEQDTQIGNTVTAFSDNGVLSFTGLNKVISAGSFEQWIVVYDFNGSASEGETFAIDLTSNNDITTSGISVSGAPANGNTATISATGSLTLSEGSFNPTARTVSASESELEMIQLNLAANTTEDIDISAITFKTAGTANEAADIDSAVLILDANNNGRYDIVYDSRIGNKITSFTDDGNITFSGLTETITAGTSENWLLLYYLNGNGSAGETFKVYFDTLGQINASGIVSMQAISPLGLPVNGYTMTISSVGTLTLALAETNPGDANFSGTATNLTMLAFTMTANDVEDINISGITVSAQTNNMVKNDIDNNDIKIYQDVDQNGLLNEAVDRFITSANYGGNGQTLGDALINISGETIAAGSSEQWLIVHTISGSSVGDYIEVSVMGSGVTGTGLISSASVNIAGSNLLGGTKTHVTGISGKLTLSPGPQNPAYRYISAGVQNESMLQFQLSADAVESIDITQIRIITAGTANDSSDLTSVRLFLDGDDNGSLNTLYDTQLGSTVSSMKDNDTLTFSGFTETISSGTAKNFIVVYNFNGVNNTVGETFKAITGNALITATGVTSTSNVVPTGGPVNGELVIITDTGTITVSAGQNNPSNTNVTNYDNNVVIIQLNVAAGINENITVTAFTFRLSGTFDDGSDFENNSFKLYVDDNNNGTYDPGEAQLDGGQSCSSDNGFVTFTGFSENILAGSDKNYILLTNLNGNASNFENFRVSFVNSTDITATGDDTGNNIYADGAPVQGGLFTVGTSGSLSLTTGANNPAAGTESASGDSVEMLQLKLTASGVENIDVTSITFTASGSGDDQNDLNDTGKGVSLYLDVNNDGLLDGGDTQFDIQRTYSANDGTVTFNLSATISAGSYQNWLVVYNLDGSASNGETFRVGIYNAGQITSNGVTSGSSITETGFPIVGNYKTIGSVGSLTLLTGDYNPGPSEIASVNEYEMLQFKLSASSIESINVDSLMITHLGTGDPVNDIQSNGVQLVRDMNNNGVYDSGIDNILANTNFSGTTAVFDLSGVTIPANTTENWLVIYNFVNSLTAGATYRARLINLTDISLTGVSSGQPIIPGGSVPVSGGTMSVAGDYGLPVELTSFTASGGHGYIILRWITESEINNLGFTIERKSENSENFMAIASYSSFENLYGAGTTSSQTQYIFNDSTVVPGQKYIYRLLQHDYNGLINIEKITPSAVANEPLPVKFELQQNYPNPFNPETTIKITIPEYSKVKITIYNILGQEIKTLLNESVVTGVYKYKWDGTNDFGSRSASGIYFYVMQVQTTKGKRIVKNRKMIMLE